MPSFADDLAAAVGRRPDAETLNRLDTLGLRAPPEMPAVLLYDIETAPARVFTWAHWNTNVVATDQDWFILSFAYKWLGDHRKPAAVAIDAACDDESDAEVVEALHALFDTADIVVAHNGDRFDQKRARTRFLRWNLPPPAPFKEVDTLKETKRYFAHYSNSLNELARFHEFGAKVPHTGIKLWMDCMAGDAEAWRLMRKYNVHDVELLEELYGRLVGWMGEPGKKAVPNRQLYTLRDVCPKCGAASEGRKSWFRRRGYYYTSHNRYPKLQCRTCGGYSRAKKGVRTEGVTAV